MKPYASFIFCAALMTCLHPACAQTAPDAGEPRFKLLDTNTVSLGKISTWEVQRVPFRFKNTSAVPASILFFTPTCPCVRGTAEPMKVLPGGETAVTLTFDPATVYGTFQRGLWVNFDDPAQKRVLLTVHGEVVPPFAGLPLEPLAFQSENTNVVWTNRCTLTASATGLRLGTPQIETNADLRIQVTLATNASEKAAYDLTLVVAPLSLGRHKASVTLPVEGGSNVPPVRIGFQARVGQALAVSPNQIRLYASGTPVTRRLLLRTDATEVKADALTWEPSIAGLSIKVRPAKRSDNLLVTAQFTPEAIQQLRAQKNAQLLFHYPHHATATVRLVAAAGNAAEPEEK